MEIPYFNEQGGVSGMKKRIKNELRAGNYYMGRELNSLNWSVGEFKLMTMNHAMFNHLETYPEEYRGVPLTEDWLGKFGFIKHVRNWIWFDNHPISVKVKYQCFAVCFIHGKLRPELVDIKFVHQLQNLYFCLTGEELQIK